MGKLGDVGAIWHLRNLDVLDNLTELDDFDVVAGWDDFTVHICDKSAELDEFAHLDVLDYSSDFANFGKPDDIGDIWRFRNCDVLDNLAKLDDFDDAAGWKDFTVQVFDKSAELDDFDNLADFDDLLCE